MTTKRKLTGAAAILALAVLTGCSGAAEAEVGECVDVEVDGADVTGFDTKDCGESHEAEVFHKFDLDGDTLPSDDQIFTRVEEECVPAFEEYTGRDFWSDEELDLTMITPSQDTWDDDDRTVTCLAVRLDGQPMTESVRA